jgi:hypothetical protein
VIGFIFGLLAFRKILLADFNFKRVLLFVVFLGWVFPYLTQTNLKRQSMKLEGGVIEQEKDLLILFVKLRKLNKSLKFFLRFGDVEFGFCGVVKIPENGLYFFGS